MNYQVLFSLKNNKKKYSRLLSAAVVVGALKVKMDWYTLPFSFVPSHINEGQLFKGKNLFLWEQILFLKS